MFCKDGLLGHEPELGLLLFKLHFLLAKRYSAPGSLRDVIGNSTKQIHPVFDYNVSPVGETHNRALGIVNSFKTLNTNNGENYVGKCT